MGKVGNEWATAAWGGGGGKQDGQPMLGESVIMGVCRIGIAGDPRSH